MKAASGHAAMRDWILGLFPWLARAGSHTYRVAKVNGDGTLELDAPAGSTLQRLASVATWIAGGVRVTPAVGSEVLASYRDDHETKSPGDNGRPRIEAFAPLADSVPQAIEIDATTTVRVGSTSHPAVHLSLGPLDALTNKDAARITDHCGRIYFNSASGVLFYSDTEAGSYAAVASGIIDPLPATPGTAIKISTGSARVKVGG